jgi:hypothetical protein
MIISFQRGVLKNTIGGPWLHSNIWVKEKHKTQYIIVKSRILWSLCVDWSWGSSWDCRRDYSRVVTTAAATTAL